MNDFNEVIFVNTNVCLQFLYMAGVLCAILDSVEIVNIIIIINSTSIL